ncbi:hypothetical protein N7474_003440 [Penicillium riverlandense]|uniref:uncharacterized protein n=1 Tax=Penicillium riverlandense TaxID=1903569 RepID=UPI0025498413|nr:uncharacterized protein N7474_003440 [Penicillium riverlandense]KAJ5826302.1 hypothetical protein N7474_003440 [Penicillium riverlandense]
MNPTPVPEAEDQERLPLIEKLAKLLELGQVDPATWACFWLADVSKLQDLVKKAEDGDAYILLFSHSGPHNDHLAKLWSARGRSVRPSVVPKSRRSSKIPRRDRSKSPAKASQPSKTIAPGGPRLLPVHQLRSDPAKKACKKRDNEFCVITHSDPGIEVAHIYPYALGQNEGTPEQTRFWANLRLFWDDTKIANWKNALARDGTETCANMLCLTPDAHRLWGQGCFSLEPIELSEDEKTLTTRFWWFPRKTSDDSVRLLTPPDVPADLTGTGRATLFDLATTRLICSGDCIVMRTEDPDNLPLPSMHLLQLQWILNRVVGLSGAAEEFLWDSDDVDSELEEELEENLEEEELKKEKKLVLRPRHDLPRPVKTPRPRLSPIQVLKARPHRPSRICHCWVLAIQMSGAGCRARDY